MIKWTRLQLSMLPTIAIEADHAIQKLQQLVNKVSHHARAEDIQALNNVRRSILTRIDALDKFYETNHLDSTISIFHMIKLKLKKAVFKVENICNEQTTLQFINKKQSAPQQSLLPLNSLALSDEKQAFKDHKSNKKSFLVQVQAKKKPKNKSITKKSALKNTNQQSFLDSYEETNLMQEPYLRHNYDNKNVNDYSFEQANNQIDPLFKNHEESIKEEHNIKHRSISGNKVTQSKPLSKKNINPHFKTQHSQKNKTQHSQKNSKFQSKLSSNISNSKHYAGQPKPKAIGQTKNHLSKKNGVQKNSNSKSANVKQMSQNVKLKADSTYIGGQNKKESQISQQFRFTIKMTKQEYQNLIRMRQVLQNEKKI